MKLLSARVQLRRESVRLRNARCQWEIRSVSISAGRYRPDSSDSLLYPNGIADPRLHVMEPQYDESWTHISMA